MTSWHEGCTVHEERLPDDGLVLAVHGEVDVASSGELRQRLRDAGAARIIVDLGDVWFIDSIAMAAIVAKQHGLAPHGRLALVADHPYVLLVLEAVGLQHVMRVFSSRTEAEAYLGS